jgi:tetratricopeptide (TPR) repeat protein
LNTSWRNLSASRVQLLIYLALAAATLIVYAGISEHDFINFDTYDYVLNAVVMNGMTQAGLHWAFTTDFTGNWHPVTWLSHMLDVELFGFMAGAHHVSNLLIHILNAWLVFYLFNKMTHRLWPAALIAALFALHPTHVESVAWVAERKDVLSGFFFLLSIGGYLHFIERPGIYRYASLLIFAALGLMSKPMLVTLPFVLLLLDYWPLQRLGQSQNVRYALLVELPRLVFEKIPLFVLAIASSVITYFVQQGAGAMNGGQYLTWYARISNAAVAYMFYLQKTLIPADLALFYPHPGQWPASDVVTSLVILGLISLACLVMLKRAPYLLVGWGWFLGMLVPVIGFVQVGTQAAADRYTYLPTIGLSIMLVFGLAHLFERHRIRVSIAASSALLVLVFYAVVAWQYVGHWRNSTTIWQHSLLVVDSNYPIAAGLITGEPEPTRIVTTLAVPYMTLGKALEQKGQLDAAILHMKEANRLAPKALDPLLHLGVMYAALNHRQAALDAIVKVTDLYPQNIEVQKVVAAVHARLGVSALPAPRVDRERPVAIDE